MLFLLGLAFGILLGFCFGCWTMEYIKKKKSQEKRGYWIGNEPNGLVFKLKCSLCGDLNGRRTKYCPSCGAKMDGAEQ